jgi:hypothetical protein
MPLRRRMIDAICVNLAPRWRVLGVPTALPRRFFQVGNSLQSFSGLNAIVGERFPSSSDVEAFPDARPISIVWLGHDILGMLPVL